MTKRRIIKWLAVLSGLCVILVFAVLLLLPRILNSQTARETIRTFLLTKTNGNVAFGNIDLAWRPKPAVIVRGATLTFADTVSGKIQSIEVYPSIMGLLRGRLDISRVEVVNPSIAVHLSEWTEEPFNIDAIESKIRALVASFATEIPGMVVGVSGGSVEVRIGDRPPVVIKELEGRLVAPPGEMQLQISSRANVFDSLRIEESIAGDTLATKGSIKINRLRLRESLAAFFPRPDEYIEDGEISVDVVLTSVGLKKIKAEIEGTSPSLALVRRARKTVIEGVTFKGVISRDEGIVSAVIQQFDLVSPRLTATGELTVDPAASTVQLKVTGRDLDVPGVRETALKIAGDIGVVEDVFQHVRGGQVPEISFQATGRSFAELGKNIAITGALRGGNILAYVLGINLDDVNGQFAVSRGILEAKQFSARYGKAQGKDGTLRLGLEGKNAPFHLDMMVQTDAAELRSLLPRVVTDDGFRKQLSRVHNMTGDLSGRLILGEKIGSLSAKVSILKAAVSGSYDPIPYPISVKEGRFEYGDGKIALEGVSGAVGLSSVSGLTGSLNYRESRQVEISSAKLALDLAQTKNLLNRFELLREELSDIAFARGKLDVTSLSLKGPLDDPGRWDFTSAGALGKIAVKHAKLPAVMNLSGGKFNATPAKFTVSNTKVSLLDAALIIDGSLESPDKAPLALDANATGAIGAQITEWISRQIDWPKQLTLRSPLQLTKGRVAWKKDGDVAFTGDLTVAGGPRISLDMVRAPQTVQVKELLVVDGGQSAGMTLDLKQDNFAFSFNGSLEQQTLNRIFQVPPLEGSLIQGDIEVSAFFEAPLRFNARGRLAGRELRVPLQNDRAVIEFFFLEADQDRLNVRSANVHWRDSRVSLMGNLLAEPKALRLNMDISADRVVWDELTQLVEREAKRGNNEGMLGMPLPPLEGTVRLNADNFTFAGFSWNPFQATASLSPDDIKAEIERGDVCGIATAGTVDFTKGEIGLDLALSVTNGQLGPTSLCLTENNQAVSGRYSLKAQVTGRGTPESVSQALTGKFEFNAQNGEVLQTPTVDTPLEATFDYLNRTGDFNVAFPDLDRESFSFQSITSRGRVEGMTIINDELIIQSSLFTIGGNARIDLENDAIDARGLVSVRLPGNTITRHIPIIGSILGGSILGIPVRVTGSLGNPNVTYLAPADVGAELLDIPRKILGLPLEAIRLFTPNMLQPERR